MGHVDADVQIRAWIALSCKDFLRYFSFFTPEKKKQFEFIINI